MKTISNVKDYSVTGVFDIAASFRAFKDSDEVKTVTLRFHLDSVPLKDLVTPALANKRITWQNGPGRSKFTSWKTGQIVDVDFSSPAKQVKTREERIDETKAMFIAAGLPAEQALELATKAIDNPEIVKD